MFVSWGGSCQDTKFRPNLVNTLLLHLKRNLQKAYLRSHHSSVGVLSRFFLYLSFLIADPPVEFFAVDAEEVFPGVDDATLDGDGPCCVDVVSGHHAHGDASTLTLLDGIRDLSNSSTSNLYKKTPQTNKKNPKHAHFCDKSCFCFWCSTLQSC